MGLLAWMKVSKLFWFSRWIVNIARFSLLNLQGSFDGIQVGLRKASWRFHGATAGDSEGSLLGLPTKRAFDAPSPGAMTNDIFGDHRRSEGSLVGDLEGFLLGQNDGSPAGTSEGASDGKSKD